jgi:hypothetical protein
MSEISRNPHGADRGWMEGQPIQKKEEGVLATYICCPLVEGVSRSQDKRKDTNLWTYSYIQSI